MAIKRESIQLNMNWTFDTALSLVICACACAYVRTRLYKVPAVCWSEISWLALMHVKYTVYCSGASVSVSWWELISVDIVYRGVFFVSTMSPWISSVCRPSVCLRTSVSLSVQFLSQKTVNWFSPAKIWRNFDKYSQFLACTIKAIT